MNENKKDVNAKIEPDIEFFVTDKQNVIRIKEMVTKYEIDLLQYKNDSALRICGCFIQQNFGSESRH